MNKENKIAPANLTFLIHENGQSLVSQFKCS
jgi:hypothetical protein